MAMKYCRQPDTMPIFPVDAPLGPTICAAGVQPFKEEDMPMTLRELLLVTAELWTDTLEGNHTLLGSNMSGQSKQYDLSGGIPGKTKQVDLSGSIPGQTKRVDLSGGIPGQTTQVDLSGGIPGQTKQVDLSGGIPGQIKQVDPSVPEKREGIPNQCVSATVGTKVSESPTSTRSTAINSGDHAASGNHPEKPCAPKNVLRDLPASENNILLNQLGAAIKAASDRDDKAPKGKKLKNMPVRMPTKHSGPQTSTERSGTIVDASRSKAPQGTEGCAADDDAEELLPDSEEDDVQVIVGPTHWAFKDVNVQDLTIPSAGKAVPVLSRSDMLALSDVRRLSALRKPTPLSFGSLLHVSSAGKCRPCMFERAPGRCRKLWLCDFCHSHNGRKHRAVNVALETLPRPGPH